MSTLDRRGFLKVSGIGAGAGLLLGFSLDGLVAASRSGVQEGQFRPNAYIRIGEDGTIVLILHRSEMGQGIRTGCAILLAEELEVGLDQVRFEQADGDPRFGNQNTDGSRSIRNFFIPLRRAGAAAREMLTLAAARRWGVDSDECEAREGEIRHSPSGRTLTYGAVATEAATLQVPDDPPLKSRDDWRLIGSVQPHIDLDEIVTGQAEYGYDVRLPGMLRASVERSPTRDGSPLNWDAEAALAVPGVVQVFPIEADDNRLFNAGVVVVARSSWAALEGRRALAVEWDLGTDDPEESEAYMAMLEAATEEPGEVYRSEGDLASAEAGAERVVERVYRGPHLAHAPMEPPNATVLITEDHCEIWAPTQHPQWARQEAGRVSEMGTEGTTVHVTLLGGGFGRKSKPDFVAEAVRVARGVVAERPGVPVQTFWTREDEIRHGWYRAQNVQRFRAGIDADGNVVSWLHRAAFPAIGSSFQGGAPAPGDGEMGQGATNMPYRIPHVQVEAAPVGSQFRIGWLRSVCNTFFARGVNCFIDELAQEASEDPIDFHLRMLGEPRIIGDPAGEWPFDTARLIHVVDVVREMSDWRGRSPGGIGSGEGWGFACHHSFLSYNAAVARVTVDGGQLRVRELWQAFDCGTTVHRDAVRQQIEGATVFGLTIALHGRIEAEDGRIRQSNFHDYPLASMSETPEIHVRLIDSDAPPTGVGEPGVPPVAPAIYNALYAATGRRFYDTPLAGQELSRG